MRVRLLHPGFFTNEHLAALPYEARLLYAGLWGLADRDGRLEDRPPRIKIQLFPFDALDVNRLLAQLVDAGFIRRYEVDGWRCIVIPSFARHQKPHLREQASKLPAPPQHHLGSASSHLNRGADQHNLGSAPEHNLGCARSHLNRGLKSRADPDPVRDPDPDPDRAVARETPGQRLDSTLRALAREALAFTTPDATDDELLDTMLYHCRSRGTVITDAQARRALLDALQTERKGRLQ